MKTIKSIFAAATGIILFGSCAKVYNSPDSRALARSEKLIAIIPPTVSIAPGKRMTGEAIIEQQRTESLNFQNHMFAWMLEKKRLGIFAQDVQDVQVTNAKLRKAGWPASGMTPEELCEVLGVDGILTSHYALSKPMSEAAAVAVAVFSSYGGAGKTNEVVVTLTITHCANSKMIWNYNKKFSGSLGSNPSMLVNRSMRQASQKMPWAR